MIDAGTQRCLLAFEAYLKQARLMQRSERRDRLRLQLAGGRVARDYRVTLVDVLDGNIATAGMNRRAFGDSQVSESRFGAPGRLLWWYGNRTVEVRGSHPFRKERGKDGAPSVAGWLRFQKLKVRHPPHNIVGSVRHDSASGRSVELDCRIHVAIASRNCSSLTFFHCSGWFTMLARKLRRNSANSSPELRPAGTSHSRII